MMIKHRLDPTFPDTHENKMLAIGLLLLGALLLILGVHLVRNIETGKALIYALIFHVFGGRAAGIGMCISRGIPTPFNIGYNLLIEVMLICLSYALFVHTLRERLAWRWLRRVTKNAVVRSRKYHDRISKYGWIGLFLFVMIPLPATGPVMGSIIGLYLGLHLLGNVAAVVAGTLSSIILWTLLFEFLKERLHVFQYIFIALIAFIVIYFFKSIRNFFTVDIKD